MTSQFSNQLILDTTVKYYDQVCDIREKAYAPLTVNVEQKLSLHNYGGEFHNSSVVS